MLGGQEDSDVAEGASDMPETAGSCPAVGLVGVVEASVIVFQSYCVETPAIEDNPAKRNHM